MIKKILIIGASILQLPAILKAKEMGFYVGVVDINPKAIGVKYADEFFNVSTIDVAGVLQTAQAFKPHGITTMATDMPMQAIAVATKELGLPGISMDTAIKSTDKAEMIKAFKRNDIESPWFYIVNNQQELNEIKSQLSFPFIIKPTDNAGSRGVIVVKELLEIDNAYNYSQSHSRGGAVIIEDFLSGSEVSVEVIVVQNKVHILAITDKITTGAPYFVEMGHSQPSRLPVNDQIRIKDLASRAVKAIGIENGPAHVEIMLTKNGPKMIELGARMGGDNITAHLVPLSTGIDMVKASIEIATGKIPDLTPRFKKGSAIRYINTSPGEISKITGIEEVENLGGVKKIVISKKTGDRVTQIQSSTDRVGYVITQGSTAKQAIDVSEIAINKIYFKKNEI